MSWIEGNQKILSTLDAEAEWARQWAIEGFLEEDVAKRELYNFFQNNITFAAGFLMGVDLYPYQSMIIKTMMIRDYVLNVLGRGSAKSFMSAVFAGLFAMMCPNSKIGILSASFRQSKHIFKYLEDIASKRNGAPFRDCITKVTKGSDEWTMQIGSSTITAVPLGDGGKLRGFRFTVILIDELLLMPQKILNEVILPFISVVPNPTERGKLKEAEDILIEAGKMKESDRHVWPNNKLIGLSSASYAFEYLYELYQVYESLITGEIVSEKLKDQIEQNKKGGASRAIFHMSYTAVPPEQYEQAAIEQFKATMSENQFARELESRFTDESQGFFRISKMRACTVPDGEEPSVRIKGDPTKKYILAIDPSWAETETSDHFAMQVLELEEESKRATLVHSYAVAGGNTGSHMAYALYLLKNFNIVMTWMDYMGGVQFVSSCNESELFRTAGVKFNVMVEDFEPNEKYSENVLAGKKEFGKGAGYPVVFRKPSSDWIRKGNELLQANFDHSKIWFGAKCFDATYQNQVASDIPIDSIDFFNDSEYKEEGRAKKIDLIEHQHNLIDLTKTECALIQIRTSPQGSQVFDLPENLKRGTGPNRTRKDSYTALVIGSWGVKVYFDMMGAKVEISSGGFCPEFVA